ncbi:MAG: patatin-like phospholipase family protein [Odoribacter sp.]|nr:patatin-like phospholipase family protein [Odoribacter sp.]
MCESQQYNLGLALSGGGARGFAHLGVFKALEEYNLKPDIISGTSAGALAGAMLASGKSPEECIEFFSKQKLFNLVRLTVSRKGLMALKGIEDKLQKFFAVEKIEELTIPLVITATDINRATPVHFTAGELLSRLLASCSIPIVFIPREIDGCSYVDGGLFMNLPVRPIRKLCKKVISVEINSVDTNQKISNMLHLAERSFHLGLASNTQEDIKLSDLFISPDGLTQYGIFDFKHIEQIYQAGYNTAKEALRDFSIQ